MDQRDGVSDGEQRGPAPSVSTPLLFLALVSIAAVFSMAPILISPSENPLKPWLAALIHCQFCSGGGSGRVTDSIYT